MGELLCSSHPDIAGPSIIIFQGQSIYTSLAAAQAEDPATLSGITQFSPEIAFIYRMTYRRITNLAGTQLVSVQAIRANNVTISGGVSPSDHSALTGRTTANSHPATAISTDTSTFDGILTTSETDVQLALNKLDDALKSTKFNLTNNQPTATNITGLSLSTSTTRGHLFITPFTVRTRERLLRV